MKKLALSNLKGFKALAGQIDLKFEVAKVSLPTATGGKLPALKIELTKEIPTLRGTTKKKKSEAFLYYKDGKFTLIYPEDKEDQFLKAVGNYIKNLSEEDLIELEKYLKASNQVSKKTETEVLKNYHPLIRFAWKTKKPLLLAGETGSGKTYTVLQIVKELLRKGLIDSFYQINLSGGIEDIDLLGKLIPTGNGKWHIVDGELVKAFKEATEGKRVVVLLEELTRSSQSARNLILKAIDPVGGRLYLNNFLTGEVYEVNPKQIWFIATANLGYEDTDELDPAFKRRFVILYKGYDEKAEREILFQLGYKTEAVGVIEQFAKEIRTLYREGELSTPLDTGTLRDFAQLLKEDKESALEFLKYKLADWENSRPVEEQTKLIEKIFKNYFGG
jgi:MoxR-like ATPase